MSLAKRPNKAVAAAAAAAATETGEPWKYTRYSGPGSVLRDKAPLPLLKITMCGEAGVGKTSFVHRVAKGDFSGANAATIGVDYHQEHIDIHGQPVALQLQDTAGQERFAIVVRTYFRDADAIAIFFDSCDRKSFVKCSTWRARVKEENPGAICVLIGTKSDLYAAKFAKSNDWLKGMQMPQHAAELECDAGYFLTSAKTGDGVFEALARITYLAWNKRKREEAAELEADRRHRGKAGETIRIHVSNTSRPTSISCCGN